MARVGVEAVCRKSLARYRRESPGRLVELNVGITKEQVGPILDELRFIPTPLAADENYEADPSHSEIVGLPPKDSPEAELIGDMIAECVIEIHLAKV